MHKASLSLQEFFHLKFLRLFSSAWLFLGLKRIFQYLFVSMSKISYIRADICIYLGTEMCEFKYSRTCI